MLRARRTWQVAVVLSIAGVALLSGAAVWVYGVYSMSEPIAPSLMGMRIDGDKVTVKVAQCPHERVRRVEVRDSMSEKLIWQADGPLTEEARNGVLTLWNAGDYDKPSPARQPTKLPEQLDVLVDFGSDGTAGDVFDTAAAKAATLPAGVYWTPNGVRTAQEIGGPVDCGARKEITP